VVGLLRVGRVGLGGGVVGGHGRLVGVGGVGEAALVGGDDLVILQRPARVVALVREDLADLLVGVLAEVAARAAAQQQRRQQAGQQRQAAPAGAAGDG